MYNMSRYKNNIFHQKGAGVRSGKTTHRSGAPLRLPLSIGQLLIYLASGGERRDSKRRVDRRKELPVTIIWENRTTS